jgi:predicted DNA-binding transcriptional regulator YafY
MDKFDRIFHLHAILSARRTAIPLEDLMARLECSRSTLHRTVNALKDYPHAPVVFDANAGVIDMRPRMQATKLTSCRASGSHLVSYRRSRSCSAS